MIGEEFAARDVSASRDPIVIPSEAEESLALALPRDFEQ